MATALHSPTRKGRSSSTHHSSNTMPVRRKEIPEVSEVAVLESELRSALLQGDLASRQRDIIREKLNRLDLSTKHNEKELELLIQAFCLIKFSTVSETLVDNVVDFVARLSESTNSGALKSSDTDALLVLLSLRLCDCLDRQSEQSDLENQLARGIIGVLRVTGLQSSWCKSILCQLLLHSVRHRQVGVPDPENTMATLLEALGYACVSSDASSHTASAAPGLAGESATTSDAAKAAILHNRKMLLQRAESLCGPTANAVEMRRRVVDELTKRIQTAHSYLSKLPAPMAASGSTKSGTFSTTSSAKLYPTGDVDTMTNLSAKLGGFSEKTVSGSTKMDCGPVTYAETERQLRILLASLRALAYLFEHCQGSASHSGGASATITATKSVVKLNASEISAYFGLVPLIDRMLRNVMPTLGRRLQLVADTEERETDDTTVDTTSTALPTPPTAAAGSVEAATAPKKALVGKTDAYRPPAQRSTATAQLVHASAAPASAEHAGGKVTGPATAPASTGSPLARNMVILKSQLSAQLVRLLGAVAALNPALFTNSWGLFLSDSIVAESALHEKCNTIVHAATEASAASMPVIGEKATQLSAPSIGKLSSPILGTVLHSSTVEVRSAAVTALLRFLSSLPLRTYFAVARPGTIGRFEARSSSTSKAVGGATQARVGLQGQGVGGGVYGGGAGAVAVGGPTSALGSGGALSKQQKLLLKIVDTLVVALDTEQNEHVLELLLKLASLLLDHMPLCDNWRTVRSARFAALTESANVYEGRATALYVLAIRAALRYDVPELAHSVVTPATFGTTFTSADAGGSAFKARNITASYVALNWVAERCKHANQTNALHRALHVAYLPASANHGTGGSNGTGGRTLIYAAAQCLLRAVAPANTNNLYCMAVRTLNSCLAQYFPALYLADATWLRNLFAVLEIHAQTGLRLQGCKMLAFLLDHDLLNMVVMPTHLPLSPPGGGDFVRDVGVSSVCFGETFAQCVTAGRTLEETYASMLRSCADDAHIVRTQAMATIGSLSAYVWRVLQGLPCSKAEHSVYLSMLGTAKGGGGDCTPLTKRLLLLRCLLVGAKDSVGTVRTAAYKSIGDCVVNSALLLSAPAPPSLAAGAASVHPLLDAAEWAYMNDLVSSLAVGILDTKLSVRVQAAWALGNTIVNLLPYRWKHGVSPAASLTVSVSGAAKQAMAQSKGHAPSQHQQQSALPYWLSDACWIALFSDLLPLLHDSEKLAATAIRCVGNVGAGLFPHLSQLHRETVCSLHDSLVQRYLVPSYTPPATRPRDSDYWQVLSNLRAPVVEHTQKVVFSLAQSLGFVLHALSRDLGRNESLTYITEVEEVHMSFLKYGKLKTQLQAAQVLLYGQCLTQDMQERGSVNDDAARTAQLIRLLECLLSLAVSTLPSKTSAVAAAVPVSRGPAHNQKGQSPAAVAERTPSTAARLKEAADAEIDGTGDSSPGGGDGGESAEVEDAPAEVVLLFRSRAAELLHYYVLLLHVVLTQLWHTCSRDGRAGEGSADMATVAERRRAVRQSVLELLLYYGEDLATWAEALGIPSFLPGHAATAPGNTVFTPINTTVGLPHVDYDICAVLHCRGRTHQAMVTEIAALVLRFSTPSDDTSNTNQSGLLGLSLQRLPSLAAEQLPTALMGRFAECAQYASTEYRHALFGAHSEYYYQRPAAVSHYHSHAGSADPAEGYGVFDGLDVQACLQSFPGSTAALLRSPARSPAKVLGMLDAAKAGTLSVEASPGLAYAVPSATEGEEDEF